MQTDPVRLAALGRRFKQLSEIVEAGRLLREALDDHQAAREMLTEVVFGLAEAHISLIQTGRNHYGRNLQRLSAILAASIGDT